MCHFLRQTSAEMYSESIKNRVQRCWIRPAGLGKPLVIQ